MSGRAHAGTSAAEPAVHIPGAVCPGSLAGDPRGHLSASPQAGLRDGEKYVFITLWKMTDWGVYRRRNEALLRELSRRECVDRVLHVEHESLKGVIYRIRQWLFSRDASLRSTLALQIRKGISLRPIAVPDDGKLFVFSVVELYSGDVRFLRRISAAVMEMQYGAINALFRGGRCRRVVIAYPTSRFLQGAIARIDHDLLIGDMVDDDIERTDDERKKEARLMNYRAVLPRCRWIMATSPSLDEKYGVYAGKKIDFLPNGVDTASYQAAAVQRRLPLSGGERKIVGYVGAVNASMDMELLEHLLGRFTDVEFRFIGHCYAEQSDEIARLTRKFPHVRFEGMRSYRDVPAIIAGFTVLISIKKTDHTTAGGDSMKIYEYLATGKPIVTTPVPPAGIFRDIIYVANDKTEFAEALAHALIEDDPGKRGRRMAASLEHDWSRRVDVILGKVASIAC